MFCIEKSYWFKAEYDIFKQNNNFWEKGVSISDVKKLWAKTFRSVLVWIKSDLLSPRNKCLNFFLILKGAQIRPCHALWGGPEFFLLSKGYSRRSKQSLEKFSSRSKIMPTWGKFKIFLPRRSKLSIKRSKWALHKGSNKI